MATTQKPRTAARKTAATTTSIAESRDKSANVDKPAKVEKPAKAAKKASPADQPIARKPSFDEQAIRERAYLIWIEEGRPEGHDLEHWLRALGELGREAA